MDSNSHTSWRCPKCGRRFGTWGDDPPISPCCNAAIDQEAIDAVAKLEELVRAKMLEDKEGGDAAK